MDIVNKGHVHRPITQFDYKNLPLLPVARKPLIFRADFCLRLNSDNELRDAFQLKLKTPMVYHQQVFWEC